MIKKITVTLSILMFAGWASSANASYVVYSAPGVATAIGGLDIGGMLYNVDFEVGGSRFSTFGGEELFWSSAGEALAAANAINDILNSSGIQLLNNLRDFFPASDLSATYAVYGGPSDDLVGGFCTSTDDPCWSTAVFENAPYEFIGSYVGTAWSVAEVPIPAAVWLFGSTLLGLGAIKHRKP